MLVFLFAAVQEDSMQWDAQAQHISGDLVLRFVYIKCSFKAKLELWFKKQASLGVG